MATIPKPRLPVSALPPNAPAERMRSLADLAPEVGYLAREIERLPAANELDGSEDFALVRDGKAMRGSVRAVLALARLKIDELLADESRRVIGGGGRHTYERSVSRAALETPADTDKFLAVRDGKAISLRIGDVLNTLTAAEILTLIKTVDGTGSGLDADLLDGQSTAFYTDIVARLGYTPVNVTDYEDGDVLTKIKNVDGAASGLDGDLLDGQHGLHYLDRTNHTGAQAIATVTGLQAELDSKAVPADITAAIAALVDASPAALDTLNELAAALGDDANFASTVTAALAAKQPLDADLTSIAALTTTAYGRALLELANGAALKALLTINAADIADASANGRSLITAADYSAMRTLLGLVIGTNVQAFDADLAAIAALSTTAYGRSLLEAANAAALRTLAGTVIGTDVAAQSHVGSGGAAHANAVSAGAAGFMTGADKTKLDGIATGATANSSDAALLARANHTGTQASSTITGTTTNDNAAAGSLEEYFSSGASAGNANTTVTMTIAAPCVVTWTAHGFTVGAATTAVKFATTGALPTGIVAGTTYYIKAIDANTFNVATSAANALAGTFITTTGSQSGVHTADIRVSLATSVVQNMAALSLGAGDWEVTGQALLAAGATTTVIHMAANLGTVSATVDRTFGRRMSITLGGVAIGNTEFTVFNLGPARFSLSGTTTIFLCADAAFGTSTMIASGWMRARRVR